MPARRVPPHLGFLPGHNKEGARSSRVKDEAQGSASKRPGLIKAISPRDNGRRDAVMVKRAMQLGEVPYCPACRGHDCWARLRWVSSSSALLLLAPGTWHSPCLSSALARWAATLQITFWGLRHSPRSHTKAPLLLKRSLREPRASLPLLAGSRRQCWEQESSAAELCGEGRPEGAACKGLGSGNDAARPGWGARGEWDFPRRHPQKSPQLCLLATGNRGAAELLPAPEPQGSASSCGRQLHELLLLPAALGNPLGRRTQPRFSAIPQPQGLATAPPSHEPTARLPGRRCVSPAGLSA